MDAMRRICLALVLLAGACGSAQSTSPNTAPTTTANEDPNGLECHEETPIGSNVPRRVCRTKLDNQMDHQGAQEWHSGVPATPTNAR